jgi:hypothetical protein
MLQVGVVDMDIGVGSVMWVELKRLRIGLWATTHPKLGVWTRRTTRVAAERKSRNGRKLGADPVEMPANCHHEGRNSDTHARDPTTLSRKLGIGDPTHPLGAEY